MAHHNKKDLFLYACFFSWSPFSCGNETGNGSSLTQVKTALDHRAESSGDFLEIDSVAPEQNCQTNTIALLHLGQAVAPDMISNGEVLIIITGKTSVYRGTTGFSGFALMKTPGRVLAESMARDLGPKGVLILWVMFQSTPLLILSGPVSVCLIRRMFFLQTV